MVRIAGNIAFTSRIRTLDRILHAFFFSHIGCVYARFGDFDGHVCKQQNIRMQNKILPKRPYHADLNDWRVWGEIKHIAHTCACVWCIGFTQTTAVKKRDVVKDS